MDPFTIAEQQLRSGIPPAAVLRQLLASHGAMPHQLPPHAGPPTMPNGAPGGPPMMGAAGPPPMGGPPPGMMGR